MKKILFHLNFLVLILKFGFLNGMMSPLFNKRKDIDPRVFALSLTNPSLNLTRSNSIPPGTKPNSGFQQNFPILGEYADPYHFFDPLIIIQNNPEMLLSGIVPNELLIEITKQFGSPDLRKIIQDNKPEFFTIFWTRPGQFAGLSTDELRNKAYNVIFHPIMQRWYGQEKDFAKNILMGIFQANGVLQKNTTGKENEIAFNKLTAQNVNIHDGTVALSPNNAQFGISANRNIVSFWILGISPETRRFVITFNIFAISQEIEEYLAQAAIGSKNLDELLEALTKMNQILKLNPDDQNDALLIVQTITRLVESIKPPEMNPKLKPIFPDEKFNTTLLPFPIQLLNAKNDLFQFAVLDQNDQGACRNLPGVLGPTCGRHSFKNGIFARLALQAYQAQNKDLFERFANDLTQLNYDSACIFNEVNKLVEEYRNEVNKSIQEEGKKRKLNENELLDDEVENVINNFSKIRTACTKLIPGLPSSSDFTMVDQDFIEGLNNAKQTGNAEFLTSDQSLKLQKFSKIIESLNSNVNFRHSIILGLKNPKHWIIVMVYKVAGGNPNFILLDSLNNADRINSPVVATLIDLIKNPPDFKLLMVKNIAGEIKNLSQSLQIQLDQLRTNAVRGSTWQGVKRIEDLSISERNQQAQSFVTTMADALLKISSLKNELKSLSPAQRKTIESETQAISNEINNLAGNFATVIQQYPILRDLEQSSINDIQSMFRQFILSPDNSNIIEAGLKKIQIIIKIPDEIKKPLLKYQQTEYPNLFNNIDEIRNGKTLLQRAVESRDKDAIQAALNLGANPSILSTEGSSALYIATEYNVLDAIELILKKYPNLVNLPNSGGATPLRVAVEGARNEAIRKLLEFKADPNIKAKDGYSASDILQNNIGRSQYIDQDLKNQLLFGPLTKYIQEFPNLAKNINEMNKDKNTILHRVVESRDIPAIKTALALGADPKIFNADGMTALHVAAVYNIIDALKIILEKYPNLVDTPNASGATSLRNAVEYARNDVIKLLLDKGANPNIKAKDGLSAKDILQQGIGRSKQISQDLKTRLL